METWRRHTPLQGSGVDSASPDGQTSPVYFQADFDFSKQAENQDVYVKFPNI